MEGINQHFIPQFLLGMFRCNPKRKNTRRKKKDTAQVHVYHSNRHYTSSTENVAQERFYYSERAGSGLATLDSQITARETHLLGDIETLRNCRRVVDAAIAARVIAHFAVRNDHPRRMLRTAQEEAADVFYEQFVTDEQLRAFLGAEGGDPGARFREIFTKYIWRETSVAALELPQEVVFKHSYMILRESAHAGFSEDIDALSNMIANWRQGSAVRSGNVHNKALAQMIDPTTNGFDSRNYWAYLEEFDWEIVHASAPQFILPDFVALALEKNGRSGSLFTVDREAIDVVMMPLASDTMLIGKRCDQTIDHTVFNALAAPHCLSFFVSAFKSDELSELACTIGTKLNAEVGNIMQAVTAEFSNAPPIGVGQECASVPLNRPIGHGVMLQTDCFTAEQTERLGQRLGQLLFFASDRFDISDLLQIHVRADYATAVENLDQGKLTGRAPAPKVADKARSAAYNVQVEREGIEGVIIVVRFDIAQALLSADSQAVDQAIRVFLGQFSCMGANALIRTVLEDGSDGEGLTDGYLIGFSVAAWRTWLVEIYGGLANPDPEVHPYVHFATALSELRRQLEVAGRAYCVHDDVDRLLAESLRLAGETLCLAAAAAGVPSNTAPPQQREQLKHALTKTGCQRWFDLFVADLHALWQEGTTYPSRSAFYVLNRHLERLLAQGAIFLWDSEQSVRVEVPYWSDWMQAQDARQQGGPGMSD